MVDHASLPDFGLGARDRQMWGWVAVPVFFVLSGFVIRYVTQTREASLQQYALDRASRIYSVALPALVLSAAVGLGCSLLRPAEFAAHWAGTFRQPVLRLALSLTFLNESWGLDATPFLNLPYWSLGYECLYYAIFGAAFYLRGRSRVIATGLLCLLAGPQVLFLLPIWLLGCVVHDVYQRLRSLRSLRAIRTAAVVLCVLLMMGAAVLLLRADAGWTGMLTRLQTGPPPVWAAVVLKKHATLLAMAVGCVSAPLLLVLLLASDAVPMRRGRLSGAIRRLGDSTFVLYLMHYPLLVLLYFAGALRAGHTAANVLAVAGMCAVLIAISPLCDALKRGLRQLFVPRTFTRYVSPVRS